MASNEEEKRRRTERELKDAKNSGASKDDIRTLEAANNAAKSKVSGGGWGILS